MTPKWTTSKQIKYRWCCCERIATASTALGDLRTKARNKKRSCWKWPHNCDKTGRDRKSNKSNVEFERPIDKCVDRRLDSADWHNNTCYWVERKKATRSTFDKKRKSRPKKRCLIAYSKLDWESWANILITSNRPEVRNEIFWGLCQSLKMNLKWK